MSPVWFWFCFPFRARKRVSIYFRRPYRFAQHGQTSSRAPAWCFSVGYSSGRIDRCFEPFLKLPSKATGAPDSLFVLMYFYPFFSRTICSKNAPSLTVDQLENRLACFDTPMSKTRGRKKKKKRKKKARTLLCDRRRGRLLLPDRARLGAISRDLAGRSPSHPPLPGGVCDVIQSTGVKRVTPRTETRSVVQLGSRRISAKRGRQTTDRPLRKRKQELRITMVVPLENSENREREGQAERSHYIAVRV